MARAMQWGIFRTQFLATAVSTVEFDMGNGYRVQMGITGIRGHTITRLIGQLTMRPTVASSTGMLDVSMGCIVGQSQSGSPAVDPQDQNADYFYHWIGGLGTEGTEGPAGFYGAHTRYINVDVRAQRKMAQMESTPYMRFRNPTASSLTVNWSGRILYRLP